MDTMTIEAIKRHQYGKGPARRLRSMAQIPAVLYGHGTTVALAVKHEEFVKLQKAKVTPGTVVQLQVMGEGAETCQVVLREVQIGPLSQAPLHIDFYRLQERA